MRNVCKIFSIQSKGFWRAVKVPGSHSNNMTVKDLLRILSVKSFQKLWEKNSETLRDSAKLLTTQSCKGVNTHKRTTKFLSKVQHTRRGFSKMRLTLSTTTDNDKNYT